jgi:hypothetical protein
VALRSSGALWIKVGRGMSILWCSGQGCVEARERPLPSSMRSEALASFVIALLKVAASMQ